EYRDCCPLPSRFYPSATEVWVACRPGSSWCVLPSKNTSAARVSRKDYQALPKHSEAVNPGNQRAATRMREHGYEVGHPCPTPNRSGWHQPAAKGRRSNPCDCQCSRLLRESSSSSYTRM